MKSHTSFQTELIRSSGKTIAGLLICALGIAAASVHADGSRWVNEKQLHELVDPALLPVGASVQVNFVKADERIGTAQCPAALFANSANNKMWGRTFVQVQCVGSDTPPFFLGVDIKVWAPVLVVKGTVQSGQAVGVNDVEFRTMNLTELKHGWVTDLAHLGNKTAARQLWPGMLLKQDYLRGQAMVKNGDTVKVMMKGPGFAIGGTAIAMGEAELGEVVKIKTAQGKILHGIARDALLVEVSL
ncbi:MAG: flagellar basal body P-ring formation chaperone FlgA [Gammaproteobacteria bacterium]|uniref:flagellar basal body P-ring formation chaperone FlgA n=1 Tax=Limnobacter sp. TaxID=2003368 RepID=UPI001D8BA344|nr:flagellar basal body P-ring formation chaperone FlgA [Limnobacter sp.]MBU0784140.1 flagellar basal body P-ring formation chaperone FlgA [Gammaproteobacteria bacterium]MBU0848257.1 flagellar basal body P-ring formation chaperone FlgA [Gammaproteobacteria bacterium]MBU1266951.1 flagellar basal body P-ring formation chaperone FlgA [Gammaproteobacteria bacterium]MBU1528464.1 flagellar basal body P-ring formation chaperone FlgA [Gammaproteobacteria bacterium]MBU1779153.1 flagellar basal body P-r